MENSNYGHKKEITEALPTSENGSTPKNHINYEAIFRDSVDAFILISPETGKIIEVNNGAVSLLRYSKEEMLRLAVWDIFSKEEYEKLRIEYLKDSISFNGILLDSEFTTAAGEKIPVAVSVKNIEDGKSLLLIARDISRVKRTEEALRREAFIFENLNDAVLITDLNGYIQSWNKAAEKIFGYSRKEVLDSFLNILFRQSEFESFFVEIKTTIAKILHWNGETAIIRKDGREGIAETSVFPFRDSSGEHIAYVIIVKDITEKKQAERLMRERDLMYRSLIESSADPIYILKGRKLLLVNSAWCRLFGYSKEEALSDSFDIMTIVAPESKSLISGKFLRSISEKPDVSTYELKGITKNNKLIDLDVRVSKIMWNGEEVYQGLYRDITEKKKHEIELTESEEKFRKLAEKSLVGIYIIQDNVFKYLNPKFTEIFGYSADELINRKGPADLTFEEDREKVNENVSSRLKGDIESIAYSFRGLRKDKRIIYVDVFGTRTIISGKPAVIGTLVDITEKMTAEKALKESEEKYRTIIESANDAIVVVDIDSGKIINVNKQAEKLTGHSVNELLGQSYLCLHADEDRDHYYKSFNEAVDQNKQIVSEVVYIKHQDGSLIPVEISNSRYTLNGRDVVQGIFRDLRERKKAEEEVRKLSRAVEQSPSAIIITDTKGNIEYVNPHFCKVTGYSMQEVLGQNPRILKSGSTSGEEYHQMWKTITAGNEWRGEFHNRKKNGNLYWEQASISPIRDEGGNITHFIAIKEDITDRKRLQEELLNAKERAEESDKMKSEFLSQMSHEIRTPLNVILSYNSFLKDELADTLNEDIRLSFDSIDTAGKRLLRTIDMILNLSAIQKGQTDKEFTPVNLRNILISLSKEFELKARVKKLYLKLKVPKENVMIPADEYLVSEIFQNLLDNSIKYTNNGGIEISMTRSENNKVRVDISDTGIGISRQYLPKLFLPFTQEETGYTRKFEGNGLGLSIVKSYLELLRADIKVESEKNRGTTFTITFNTFDRTS